jgi:hypothetical protein
LSADRHELDAASKAVVPGIGFSGAELIRDRVRALLAGIEVEPKSCGWRLRARVGERVRWHDTPEEIESG